MKKLLALLLSLSVSTTAIADTGSDFQTISIENGLDRNERRVRDAAVSSQQSAVCQLSAVSSRQQRSEKDPQSSETEIDPRSPQVTVQCLAHKTTSPECLLTKFSMIMIVSVQYSRFVQELKITLQLELAVPPTMAAGDWSVDSDGVGDQSINSNSTTVDKMLSLAIVKCQSLNARWRVGLRQQRQRQLKPHRVV